MNLTREEFVYIQELVHTRSGVLLSPEKGYLVEARLKPLARSLDFSGLSSFIHTLQRTEYGSQHRRAVEAMTTNETSFFRDPDVFEALREQVIPLLITKRKAEKVLCIWCGASSSGQEPYSLALLLKEHFPDLQGWRIDFFATDISQTMIKRAQLGEFSEIEIDRGLPKYLLTKYFEKRLESWRIQEGVCKMIQFREMNLIGPWIEFPSLDLVLLRNVLIYFDERTKKEVLRKIWRSLKPDGFLALGGTETTFGLQQNFRRVPFDRVSLYQPCEKRGTTSVVEA